MSVMYSCASDWSFDKFVECLNTCKALPLPRGVYRNGTYAEEFCTWLKTDTNSFVAEWLEEHDGRMYDRYDGYIGDAWVRAMDWSFFSDYYKDAFNQRPHLSKDLYAIALGLSTSSDVLRRWDRLDVEHYCSMARDLRKAMLEAFSE